MVTHMGNLHPSQVTNGNQSSIFVIRERTLKAIVDKKSHKEGI